MGLLAALVVVAAAAVVVVEAPYATAAVYKVGDDNGWTSLGAINYKEWAVDKTFSIGDTIIFEYNPQFHNVMRVSHTEYRACNVSAPIESFATGNDTYDLKTNGHHFFVCGTPGHCEAGQKVDINVARSNSSAAPSPLGTGSVPNPKPSPARNDTPAPSPSAAAPLCAFQGIIGKLGLAIALCAVSISGLAYA